MIIGIYGLNKKTIKIVSIIVLVLSLSACDNKNNYKEIHTIMREYLTEIGINDYNIKKIKDYDDINVDIKIKEVSQSDIDNYIKEDLEEHEDSYVVTSRNYVKNNDVVTITYITKIDDDIKSKSEKHFMVGSGSFNKQIEEYIIGKKLNEEYTFEIEKPIEYDLQHIDRKEVFTFTISEIRKVNKCVLNKKFVKDNYNLDTISDYYKYVEDILKKKNQYESELDKETKINKELLKCFDIKLNNEEVAKYSLNIVDEYNEIANMYGMSLEEYASSEYNISKDELVRKSYYEGEERLKTFIIYGYIAENEQISVKKEDIIEESADALINSVMELLKNRKE